MVCQTLGHGLYHWKTHTRIMTIIDDMLNIRDMVYISGTHKQKRMMTIGDMSNIKDTILDLWNTQA